MVRAGDVVCSRYVLREQIGGGGMGTVYLADEPALARTVAIKILHSRFVHDRKVTAAFREEAVAASRVRHPSCLSIIESSQLADGTPVIVMEHVPGRSLGRVISEDSIPLARAIELMTQILSALDAAHASGVVHGDVKSDNFLVETIDGGDHVTLIDFGLARIDGVAPIADMLSGTPEYMAPEVIRGGHPTPGSDRYGTGVILYELLTGTTPFGGGKTEDVLARQLLDIVVPPSLRAPERELPAALDQIVLRMLAKQPDARFLGAAEMIRALRSLLRTPSIRDARALHWDRASGGDAITRNCTPEPQPPRLARGSKPALGELAALRNQIGEAILSGDVALIESAYIALAAALVRDHQLADAAREIEEAIALLGPHSQSDRLAAELGALYATANQRTTWRA